MHLARCVQTLHAEYATLALAGHRSLTDDQVRSLAFYRAELAFIENPTAFTDSRNQIMKWVRLVHAIETFVTANGRLPGQNNRLPPEEIDRQEWDLAEWKRYQQGRALRNGHLCSYQRRRNACVPGFRERPRQAKWDDRLQDYRSFVAAHVGSPRYRSVDTVEKSLARWRTTQLTAYRAGTLSPRRRKLLSAVEGWSWNDDGAGRWPAETHRAFSRQRPARHNPNR